MITKSYSIMCSNCTRSEGLFSQTVKDCEYEASRMGWQKVKGEWLCDECVMDKEISAISNGKSVDK